VKPEERKDFVEKAKDIYSDVLTYEITFGNGEGILFPRFVDDEDMYPLLYSNPTTLTYTGVDFRIPPESIDEAIKGRKGVSTDKVILSFFGGLS